MMAERFGCTADGIFVEIGAFDGELCSNTSFLADLGWRGVYVEPIPEYAAACAARHRRNPGISVLQCAVGPAEQMTTLQVGNVLTTADAETAQAYGQIEWAKGFLKGETLSVRQVRLEAILQNEGIPVGFDLLVVDVEGGEEGVFTSFDLASWMPSMIIVELEDEEPSMQPFPSLTARAARVRDLIRRHGYSAIYRDTINTVFWAAAA
jgi:FkbM family methyltransferase